MAQMQLVTGLVLGVLAAGLIWTLRNLWQRQRQTRHMVSDLSKLELPLLMVDFPSRRVHASPALAELLDLDLIPGQAHLLSNKLRGSQRPGS